jgi:hypothetical protein
VTKKLLIQGSDPELLADISDYLHDARYSLGEVAYDETQRLVLIPFRWDATLRQGSAFRRQRAEFSKFRWRDGLCRELRVASVDHVELDDPSRLIEHSCAKLTYGDGTLIVQSNFPGSIQIQVSTLDVQLLEEDLN